MFKKDLLKIIEQFRSDITGMLHVNFVDHEKNSETIPLYENACYCLLLLRTHDKKKMLFAMEMLEKLLHLQSSEGTFPLYFHHFPLVEKPMLSLRWIFPLFWINKKYGHVLPHALRERVKLTLEKLLELDDTGRYSVVNSVYYSLPYSLDDLGEVKSSRDLIFRGLLLNVMGERIDDNLFDQYYNRFLSRYIGPGTHEFCVGFQSKDALLHLLVDQDVNLAKLSPYELFQAPLIFSHIEVGQAVENNYELLHVKEFDPRTYSKSNLRGLHLLRLLMKDNSFVCQTSKHLVSTQEYEDRVEIDFTFLDDHSGDEKMDIAFYTERRDGSTSFFVDDQKASLFHLNNKVKILIDQEVFTLSFKHCDGEGDVTGHIQFGNRPSQTCSKIKREHKLYDWMIGLRGIRYKKGYKLRTILHHSTQSTECSISE